MRADNAGFILDNGAVCLDNDDSRISGSCQQEKTMYYIVESNKSFEEAVIDLESAVKRNEFGVLHIHDLGNTLRSKGIAFGENCKVLEVCNPGQAGRVLSTDMRLNMALPCRISVFTEHGKTMIGMIKPVPMLASLSQDASLVKVAQEVEAKTIKMIDEAR
jgi:uncharacterized protein (DUF302 family)